VTIADLVADERAPTPSAAAERVVPDRDEWRRKVGADARRLVLAVRAGSPSAGRRCGSAGSDWPGWHPGVALRRHAQRLDELAGRLALALRARLRQHRARHGTAQACCCAPRRRCASRPCACASRARAAASPLPARRARGSPAAARPRGTHPERGEPARDPGPRLRHRQRPDGHVVQDATALRTGDRIAARLARARSRRRCSRSRPDPPTADGRHDRGPDSARRDGPAVCDQPIDARRAAARHRRRRARTARPPRRPSPAPGPVLPRESRVPAGSRSSSSAPATQRRESCRSTSIAHRYCAPATAGWRSSASRSTSRPARTPPGCSPGADAGPRALEFAVAASSTPSSGSPSQTSGTSIPRRRTSRASPRNASASTPRSAPTARTSDPPSCWRRPLPVGAPAASACGGSSTASRATRTAAWTLLRPRARRC